MGHKYQESIMEAVVMVGLCRLMGGSSPNRDKRKGTVSLDLCKVWSLDHCGSTVNLSMMK